MDKRYQVFVSSTFADLQEERREVIQTLLELGCIPAGMELFPAADDDQWTLIKKVIDDCDYYIVIIGGRYGTLSNSGVSYTQMEYEYADSKGKPIIGFLHKNPGSIPSAKTERTEAGQQQLTVFRERIQKKMCKYWSNSSDLSSKISSSLIQLIKEKPGRGWIRGELELDQSTDEISKIASELGKIRGSLSTHYIGIINDYLPLVVSQFEKAEKSITILCDFPAYGYFTAHDEYNKYRIALLSRIDQGVKVSMMCLDEPARADSNLKVLLITDDNWKEWKQKEVHLDWLQKLGYSIGDIANLDKKDFLETLDRVDREMLNVYCRGAIIEEVNADLPIDIWLIDSKRAIFAFSTYSGDASQYGFFTEDNKLISAFVDIKDRYHRNKVRGAI
jgi:hypothetical protein